MALTESLGGGLDIGGKLGGSLSKLMASAAGILVLSKAGFRVREGEVATRERWGKVRRDSNGTPKIYRPGFHPMFPGVHSYKRISIQDETEQIPLFDFNRDRQYTAHATLTWGVSPEGDNPYRALYLIDTFTELKQKVHSVGRQAVWAALMEHDEEQVLSPNLASQIYESVEDRCSGPFSRYGAELRGVEVITALSPAEMLRQTLREVGAIPLATLVGNNGNGHHELNGNGVQPLAIVSE
jgi:regulator of protease activity HflC (stomatin/prohibitin superfamily)